MKLTQTEKTWLNRLQTVLNECPSGRIGFYTIGDASLNLYDRRKEDKIGEFQDGPRGMDFCGAVRAAKAEIDADLSFPANIHSTAG